MIEFQRLLLGDRLRNEVFYRALQSVIVPGKTVLADIGSGTGYLSFLAEKLGAKECHLYEVSELLDLSKTLAKENDMKHCTFYRTHSTAVKNPVKADVIVSETIGNWPYEENIIETMNDAQRFLKPGGVMIPQELRSFVAPVTASRLYDELNVWDRIGHGLTLNAAKAVCMNNMYVKDILPADLPSPTAVGEGGAPEAHRVRPGGEGKVDAWDIVDFSKRNDSIREATLEWTFATHETLYGFAIWWEATLVKGITLSTSPFERSTHWKQIYLPVTDPLPVKKGQTISLKIHSDSRYEVKIGVEWTTTITDSRGKTLHRLEQNIKKGYLS